MALNVHINIPLLCYIIHLPSKKQFLNFCVSGGTVGGGVVYCESVKEKRKIIKNSEPQTATNYYKFPHCKEWISAVKRKHLRPFLKSDANRKSLRGLRRVFTEFVSPYFHIH